MPHVNHVLIGPGLLKTVAVHKEQRNRLTDRQIDYFVMIYLYDFFQCFDIVCWVTGKASCLLKFYVN